MSDLPASADEPDFEPTPWLEQHPLAHWLFELDTLQVLWSNAAAQARYGHDAAAFLQLTRDDLLAPDEWPRARAFMAALPHSLRQQPVWRERTRDGRVLMADWRGITVRWQGRRARLLTVMDAGVREELLVEQQRTRSQLEALIAAIPDLWMVYDADFRYLQVSDPAHPGLSAPWSEKLGRSIHETVAPELAATLVRLAAEARRTGQPQSHHYEIQVVDGQRRWFESRYVAMSEGRTLALIRDVTETHELERRFQDLAEAAPIGIFVADAAGEVSYANTSWQRLMSLAGDEALGLGWARAVHPDDLAAVAEAWRRFTAGSVGFEMEFRVQATAVLAERTVWAQARPLPPRRDGAVSFVGCVVDVTPARELQREREARAVAEEAGRRQVAFLSRVSHELRTPLNAILGFGELLRRDLAAEPRQAGFVGHVVEAGRHMLALVDDLLELQRIQQGRFEPQMGAVDVTALLQAVEQMLLPLVQGNGLRLQSVPEPGLVLHSDERAVRQILLNLAGNAIKYGHRGGAVRLAVRRDGDRVLFEVQDDGPGMSEEQLQRLFTPFERLGQDHGTVAGSGLGLVISRQLAQALGGSLTLASVPGAGTTATLALPLGG